MAGSSCSGEIDQLVDLLTGSDPSIESSFQSSWRVEPVVFVDGTDSSEQLDVSASSPTHVGDLRQTYTWNRASTLLLIDAYRQFEGLVTNPSYRKKAVWEKIYGVVREQYPGVKREFCENRWKVLLRNYKKTIDNNNETGVLCQTVSSKYKTIW